MSEKETFRNDRKGSQKCYSGLSPSEVGYKTKCERLEKELARKDELLRRAVGVINCFLLHDTPDLEIQYKNDELAKQLAADIEAELGRGK